MASAIFTDDVLQSSTCKGSRSSHGTSGKPGLPLKGLMALKGNFDILFLKAETSFPVNYALLWYGWTASVSYFFRSFF